MLIMRICILVVPVILLAGCETSPPRPAEASPPADPVRAALAEANKAYSAHDDAKALSLYLPLARSGSREAQVRAARIFSRNKGVAPDDNEACNWWEAAAGQGEATAATFLGICFETGKGRAKSLPLSAQWYRRGADAGDAYGMYNLGLAFEYGAGVTQSFEAAAGWFQRALSAKLDAGDIVDAQRHLKRCMNHVDAARGVPQAQYDLAIDLFNGHEPEVKDERRAVAAMREAARGNLPEAWFIHGSWLHAGFGGVKSDPAQAATWIKKAADTGHERATIRYADITLCGIGVKKDIASAERILRQAIDRGSWIAMGTMSRWYQNGDCGFRRDASLAADWSAKADAAQRAKP
jgi:hypothetical protein